jgi:hypothetical protein
MVDTNQCTSIGAEKFKMKRLLLLLLLVCCQVVAAALQAITTSTTSSTTTSVANVAVHRVPLYRNHDDSNNLDSSSSSYSPYCFAVSNPMTTLPNTNFLASQVWPSARVAAMALERLITALYNDNDNNNNNNGFADDATRRSSLTICEFGCGPGLPSLTAAVVSKQLQQQQQQQDQKKNPPPIVAKVYATDVDSFALQLVQAAAREQSIMTTDPLVVVETRLFDLTRSTSDNVELQRLPVADLYLFSDVFESSAVARGAAHITCRALFEEEEETSNTVWVFCQSDRAQRQVYVEEMQRLLAERAKDDPDDDDFNTIQQSLSWQDHGDWPSISTTSTKRLWLCNVDETKVRYG